MITLGAGTAAGAGAAGLIESGNRSLRYGLAGDPNSTRAKTATVGGHILKTLGAILGSVSSLLLFCGSIFTTHEYLGKISVLSSITPILGLILGIATAAFAGRVLHRLW